MARSYRRPFYYITGKWGNSQDKVVASRCWRRKQNHALRACEDYEEYVNPVRLEAPHNNRYSWSTDGSSRPASSRPWRINAWENYEKELADHLRWFAEMQRK